MHKFAAIVQARCSSSRFPDKVLAKISSYKLLELLFARLSRSQCIDQIILATTSLKSDDRLENLANKSSVGCIRGEINDVLARYVRAISITDATHIVRITGDCPFIDPNILDDAIDYYVERGLEYLHNPVILMVWILRYSRVQHFLMLIVMLSQIMIESMLLLGSDLLQSTKSISSLLRMIFQLFV